ncbi:RNA-binding protein 28-like [Dysidea avara]|uniref:RNA-binding protein 28-like n=1 Tax=Dysidea avara TaxID=196820 RepID=UPI00332FB2DD
MSQVDTSEKTLFVRGLDYSTTDTQLEEAFSDYGPIKTCFTVKDKGTKDKCRGFGYVIYCTRDDASRAIEGVKNIKGRKVQVSFAAKREPKKGKRKKSEVKDDEATDEVTTKKPKLDNAQSNDDDVSKTAKKAVTATEAKPKSGSTVSVKASTAVLTGLPSGVTKKQIYKRCRKVGEVVNITYPVEGRDNDTALVQYSNHQVTTKAISALNGKIFKGSTLSAVLFIQENKKISKKTLQRSRLIVRNLKFKCSEETLSEIFSKYGKVVEVQIPTKPDGKRVGCGFVQYSSVFDASRAVKQMNGQEIQGRVVAVDWVVPKSQYEEAKLVGVQDDSPEEEGDQDDQEDNDEDPASSDQQEDQQSDQGDQHSDQEIQQSDQEDQLSDQEDNTSDVMSEDVGSDDDDDVNDEEDEDNDMLTDHDKSKPRTPSHKRKLTNDVSEGRTVFIRNLSFDTDEDDLTDMFTEFGNISYCKIVMNTQTGLPKGTAFVQFKDSEAAESCITAANTTDGKGLFLDGRQLNVILALSREEASKIKSTDDSKKVDKRNLYLAKEGTMDLQSVNAKKLSKPELVKRQRAAVEKKAKLANPNYFVSKTRISVRNLSATVSENQLKDALLKYAKGTPVQIKQVKIMRSKDRINSQGIGRSMGYGFVEFTTHEAALAVVRAVSNNPSVFGPHKIPIVEFAMENARAINLRKERLKRQAHLRLRRTESSPASTTLPVDSDKKQQAQISKGKKPITTKSRVYKKMGKGKKKR